MWLLIHERVKKLLAQDTHKVVEALGLFFFFTGLLRSFSQQLSGSSFLVVVRHCNSVTVFLLLLSRSSLSSCLVFLFPFLFCYFSAFKVTNGGIVMVSFFSLFVSCNKTTTIPDVIGKWFPAHCCYLYTLSLASFALSFVFLFSFHPLFSLLFRCVFYERPVVQRAWRSTESFSKGFLLITSCFSFLSPFTMMVGLAIFF